MLGANVPYSAIIDTFAVFDFDLLHIGESAALNHQCNASPHDVYSLHHIRLHRVQIEANACIGLYSPVHGNVTVCQAAFVDHGTRVTVGEKLPPFTVWRGSPARMLKSTSPALSFVSPVFSSRLNSQLRMSLLSATGSFPNKLLRPHASGEGIASNAVFARSPRGARADMPKLFERCPPQRLSNVLVMFVSFDEIFADADGEVPAVSVDALRLLIDRGVRVVLLTDRSVAFTRALVQSLPFTAAIAEGGAALIVRLKNVSEGSSTVVPIFSMPDEFVRRFRRKALLSLACQLQTSAECAALRLRAHDDANEREQSVALSVSAPLPPTVVSGPLSNVDASNSLALALTQAAVQALAMIESAALTVGLSVSVSDSGGSILLRGQPSQVESDMLRALTLLLWGRELEFVAVRSLLVVGREGCYSPGLLSLFPLSIRAGSAQRGSGEALSESPLKGSKATSGQPTYELTDTAISEDDHSTFALIVARMLSA